MKKNLSLQEMIFYNFLNICDEKTLILHCHDDPYIIRYIENPSERVQLKAVKQNGYAIKYIKNPSEEVQLKAIKEDGHALGYIENPNNKMQLLAINNYNSEYDEIWFINNCLKKIKSPIALIQLYNKVDYESSKIKIKKSKYWKDDANIILDTINNSN